MISLELFSQVLKKEIVSFDFDMGGNIDYKVENDYGSSINICEFAQKCKNWAALQYMPITSKTSRQGGIAKIRIRVDGKNHHNTIFSSEYLYSEQEAIFKVCQWIFDSKIEKDQNEK